MHKYIVSFVILFSLFFSALASADMPMTDDAEKLELLNLLLENQQKSGVGSEHASNSLELSRKPQKAPVVNDALTLKAKELIGTWIISYKVNGIPYTDKMVISGDVSITNGLRVIKGLFYNDLKDTADDISCTYSFTINYGCLVKIRSGYVAYNFKFAGDTITNGFFQTGLTTDDVVNSPEIPITGYRVVASVTTPQIPCVFNWLEAKYPQYYAPASTAATGLLTYTGNSYRYYAKTDSLLVYNPTYDHVYSGYNYQGTYYYIDLGSLPAWKSGTGCSSSVAPIPPTSSYKIGDKGLSGGIVFYVDSTGLHGLEAQPADYNNGKDYFTWQDAMTAASSYGSGWRLPTIEELNLLCKNQSVIGGFYDFGFYWSSTENGSSDAWNQLFSTTTNYLSQGHVSKDFYGIRIRAVRSF